MRKLILPRLIRWMLWTGAWLLLIMTLLRLGLFLGFSSQQNSFTDVASAFWLGLRYDLRSVSILLLLMLLIGSIGIFHPFRHKAARRGWFLFLGIFSVFFIFFYIVDFAHYAYLLQRLNAGVLNYLDDAGISLHMVWQSYPVIWLLLAIIFFTLLFIWLFARGYRRIASTAVPISKRTRNLSFIFSFLILGFFVFGRFNQFPLRWSDAFSLGSDYKANLALNPFESFFNTLQFRKTTYNEKKLKEYYPLMASYLGVPHPDADSLNYTRDFEGVADSLKKRPNIIFVICESFSGYKSSMWGNPLNTTPFFDSLSRKGLFFDHCFTPTYGTARGVWASITGIPDVEMPTTASRNPLAVDQRSIINDFKGYQKYYFIGGSPSWANIRGLLMNNIDGLHLYEEENMQAPKLDVWGISDKNLFLEADRILAQEKEPFFAIIQTADNHRPYSIPEEDLKEFKPVTVPEDSLKAYGFDKLEELNAFRYTDFCFRKFFDASSKHDYHRNTLFVFVGDHGIPGDAGQMFPSAWTEQRLTAEHVPLLFYGPGWLQASRQSKVCSQVDVLPTIAGLCGIPYSNTTLGRNLADSNGLPEAAFIFDPEYRQRGVISKGYFYREQILTGKQEIVPIDPALAGTMPAASLRDSLQELSRAIFETSRYWLLHNKKAK